MSNYVCSSKAQIKPEAFHRIVGGDQVDLYTLKNSNGLEAKITNYGGIASERPVQLLLLFVKPPLSVS